MTRDLTSTIGFPGLGIEEFTLNRTAFVVFGIHVQWYGVILTVGILVAFLLFYIRGRKNENLSEDDILNLTLLAVPISIIGARTVYVLTTIGDGRYKTFYDVIAIWDGGIAIYGAILFGLATVLVYCKIKKLKALSVLDALAPAVMMGQIIGRWGNFVNAEAYGWSEGIEALPWRMTVGKVYLNGVYRPDIEFVHPTFLYESLWNLIGFVIIQLVYRRKKANGEIFSLYMLWYGFGRAFIEMLRADSLYLFGTGIKFSVFTGIVCFIAGTALLVTVLKKAKKASAELEQYKKLYAAVDGFDVTDIKTEAEDGELTEKVTELEARLGDLDENDASTIEEEDNSHDNT